MLLFRLDSLPLCPISLSGPSVSEAKAEGAIGQLCRSLAPTISRKDGCEMYFVVEKRIAGKDSSQRLQL